MPERTIDLIYRGLETKAGRWFGGPSPAGNLRNVSWERALWKPEGVKHSVWELALHIAYWEYAVRRMLVNGPKGGFPRAPSNWPSPPATPSREAWAADRALVRDERDLLLEAVEEFDGARLHHPASPRSKHTFAEVLLGAMEHSVYHNGQVSLLKRMKGPNEVQKTSDRREK